MTESQAHGFTWETFIKEKIYNVPDKAAYTRKNDIDSNENTFDNCAVSIKTSGSVSVDMGDARRIFEGTSSGEPYRMIVIPTKNSLAMSVIKKSQPFTKLLRKFLLDCHKIKII